MSFLEDKTYIRIVSWFAVFLKSTTLPTAKKYNLPEYKYCD